MSSESRVFARPSFTPFALAFASPFFTRSIRMSLSSCATAPRIAKIATPSGEFVSMFSLIDTNSTPSAELADGNEIEIGVVKNEAGKEWITVTLPSGQWGYMPGESIIRFTLDLSLFENQTTVYSEPSKQSTVITIMKKNTRYHVLPFGSQAERERWVKIRDSAGNEGFIDGQTRGKKV